ncbi:CD276 antigen homolog [Amblyraja radiata]|uniref:CD276 antigen homolog n=1 Tax=Amblyraja radiata TaxID=386614 RepID=UPI00140335C6|nr:CD276 antigen homolog [Amblyraja radiata]
MVVAIPVTLKWAWSPRPLQQWKVIASANRSQPITINVNGTNFVNRLVTSGKLYDGKDFNVRIVPVVFQDAGVYACFLESNPFPIIDLITVKVTAEPSDAVTEGDNVTLTCSVSHVIESMRLVWINGDGKRVGEKALTVEEKSLSLVIQKAERGRGNWRCVLFHQDLPRLFVPCQEPRVRGIRIIIVLGYLVIKLAVALGLICCSWRMNRSCRNPREVTGNVTNNSNEAVAMQTLNSDPDLRDQNE